MNCIKMFFFDFFVQLNPFYIKCENVCDNFPVKVRHKFVIVNPTRLSSSSLSSSYWQFPSAGLLHSVSTVLVGDHLVEWLFLSLIICAMCLCPLALVSGQFNACQLSIFPTHSSSVLVMMMMRCFALRSTVTSSSVQAAVSPPPLSHHQSLTRELWSSSSSLTVAANLKPDQLTTSSTRVSSIIEFAISNIIDNLLLPSHFLLLLLHPSSYKHFTLFFKGFVLHLLGSYPFKVTTLLCNRLSKMSIAKGKRSSSSGSFSTVPSVLKHIVIFTILIPWALCFAVPNFSSSSSPPGNGQNDRCFRRTISSSVVKIKYGTLRGMVFHLEAGLPATNANTNNNNNNNNRTAFTASEKATRLSPVEAFLGVPYASPPTGALRFMPPVTPAHWRGVRTVDHLSPLCPQKLPYADLLAHNSTEALKKMPLARFEWLRRLAPRTANQSEDCLYLNIYTPAVDLGALQQQQKQSKKQSNQASAASSIDPSEEEEEEIELKNGNVQGDQAFVEKLSDDNDLNNALLNDEEADENDEEDGVYVEMVESLHVRSKATAMLNDQLLTARHRRHRSVVNPSTGSASTASANSNTNGQAPTNDNGAFDKRRRQANFPVIVFLTGESYDWNLGSLYDGSLLASFGQVLVVTLNFRLGILGFLPASVDGTVRGNYGLMDQVAALHWIQENIAEFGGSPANVTIIGHGHGAACAHLLMLSPMAKGLFNRVILMSGSSLNPWAIARDATVYARDVGRQLNCPLSENSLMVDCLRAKSVDELLSVTVQVPDYLTAFGPIIDGIVVPSEPRMLQHTVKQTTQQQNVAAQQSRTSPIPSSSGSSGVGSERSTSSGSSSSGSGSSGHLHHRLHYHSSSSSSHSNMQHQSSNNNNNNWSPDLMVGVTRVEAPPIFSSHEERNGISVARRDRILRTLVRNSFDYHQQAIFYTLVNEYTDWTRPVEHPISLMDSLIELLGDALVVAPLVEALDHHQLISALRNSNSNNFVHQQQGSNSNTRSTSSSSSSRSYFYVFSHQSEEHSKNRYHERLGCSHGDELAYLFGVPLLSGASFVLNRHPQSASSSSSLYSNLYCDTDYDNPAISSNSNNNNEEEDNSSQTSSSESNNNNALHQHNSFRYPTLDISPSHYPSSSGSTFLNYTNAEIQLSKMIITYWVHFAAFGDPNVFWRDSTSQSSLSSLSTSSLTGHDEYGHEKDQSGDKQLSDQEDGSNTNAGSVHARRYHHHLRSSSSSSLNRATSTNVISSSNDLTSSLSSSSPSATFQSYHLHQLSQQGYEHVHNSRLDSVLWPTYETTQKKYLNFGSKVKVRDHYHSHRLSIWLSLIPRLHIPIELQQQHHQQQLPQHQQKYPEYSMSEMESLNESELEMIEPEQYFYLKHHLLPDHENMNTYDGVVKQLAIRIPSGQGWQRKHLRQNMTSYYEQHQQMLYGKLYAHKNSPINEFTGGGGGGGTGSGNSRLNRNQFPGSKNTIGNEQFAGRRASDDRTVQVNEINSDLKEAISVDTANNPENANVINSPDESIDLYEVSSTATTSVLHFEAQTSDTYSTALLVTIVVGCSLLVLNILIFIGVYYQLDRKSERASSLTLPLDSESIISVQELAGGSTATVSPGKSVVQHHHHSSSHTTTILETVPNFTSSVHHRAVNNHHQNSPNSSKNKNNVKVPENIKTSPIMPNSSPSTRLTQHRFSFPDNKFLLDESEKDHHHHHHHNPPPNEHYIVSNGDPQFSENCQIGHNCDSKYRTLPSLRCHSLKQQQTVQQQHSSNNNSTTNSLSQSNFPNSPNYSTQTLGRYHKAPPPSSSGPNPAIQTHLEFHHSEQPSPPVYYVHYPISETQFTSYSIDPTTAHQLTSNHSTPLRSILKSSKRFPPNYLTTSESATSSSNNSSDLNHNQAPIEMSTYPLTQIDPNHQQQQQSLALVFESTNVNAHCESGGIQFIQTSCDNNQTATFVDGGNFVSYLPHHPDQLNNPDLQQHQELAHLPYLTLTEIYPSPPPPLPQTSQAQTK